MNKLDSELVTSALVRAGFIAIDQPDEADLAVLNTCSVRRHAEDKAVSRVGHWHHLRQQKGRPRLIALIGCFAQRDPDQIRQKMNFVDIICGPGKLHDLVALARASDAGRSVVAVDDFRAIRAGRFRQDEQLDDFDLHHQIRQGQFQAFVRAQRGCDKFCSYCIVPFVRGPENSRAPGQILEEVKNLEQAGCREITLLGQTISSYRYHANGDLVNLADLLHKVHDATTIPRIRFVTSYPACFPIEILHAMAELERVSPYLHIPAQHGSDHILRQMNRKYTVEQYLELIDQARKIVPGLSLAGDFISGFPGETEQDHQASLQLVQRVRYKNCFVFKYSPRPDTPAQKRFDDDIPDEIKSVRLRQLLDLQDAIAAEANRQLIGKTVHVLVEGPSKKQKSSQHGHQLVGRTCDDKIVVFDGPIALAGDSVLVRIREASSLTLFAERA